MEVGDIKQKWSLFKASNAEAAAESCGLRVIGASRGVILEDGGEGSRQTEIGGIPGNVSVGAFCAL